MFDDDQFRNAVGDAMCKAIQAVAKEYADIYPDGMVIPVLVVDTPGGTNVYKYTDDSAEYALERAMHALYAGRNRKIGGDHA